MINKETKSKINKSDDDLLDMHYFLEDDDFDPEDEVGAEGFYIF